MKGKPVEGEWWYGLSLRSHIIFGIIAIFIGPFQFIEKLRTKHLNTHRIVGYIYVFSVLISAFCGLIVAQFSNGWNYFTIRIFNISGFLALFII